MWLVARAQGGIRDTHPRHPRTEPGTSTPSEGARRVEEFHCTGDQLLARVRELLHEENVRRIALKNEEGHTSVEFPPTVGVADALFAPWLAAHLTIVVERER